MAGIKNILRGAGIKNIHKYIYKHPTGVNNLRKCLTAKRSKNVGEKLPEECPAPGCRRCKRRQGARRGQRREARSSKRHQSQSNVYLYTCMLVYLYTRILVRLRTIKVSQMYTCILVCLYTCILVYSFVCAPSKSVKYKRNIKVSQVQA